MLFRIFVLNRVSNLSIFVLIRVSIYQFLSYTGCLFLDDKQQNFYKLLLINIRVKRLKQSIKNRYSVLRWPNTVFARALADAILHVHKDFKKQTCRQ